MLESRATFGMIVGHSGGRSKALVTFKRSTHRRLVQHPGVVIVKRPVPAEQLPREPEVYHAVRVTVRRHVHRRPPTRAARVHCRRRDSTAAPSTPPPRGRVSPPELVAKSVVSPSWLRWHPTMPVMYTTQETGDGSPSALVSYRLSQNGCEATNPNNIHIPRVRSRSLTFCTLA
jgi:hypothetical protein